MVFCCAPAQQGTPTCGGNGLRLETLNLLRRRWAPTRNTEIGAEEMGSYWKQEHMTTVVGFCSQLVMRNHEDYFAVRPFFEFVFEVFCFNRHFTAERICVSSFSVRAVHYNQLVNKYRIQYNSRRKLVATMLDITDTTSCVRFKFKSVQYDYMLKNTQTFTQVKTEEQ